MSNPTVIPSQTDVGSTVRHDVLPLDRPIDAQAPRRTAVIAVHGMGQQKIFETVAQVATSIRDYAGAFQRDTICSTAVDAHIGDQRMGRIELELKGEKKTRHVHVYEAYWAPLTEGQVTLRDVMSFLFRAGLTGLRNAIGFERTMFGQRYKFPVALGTPVALVVALIAIGALIAVNSVMTAVLAAKVTWRGGSWPSNHTINDLSAVSAVLAIFLLLVGVALFLALHAKRFSHGVGSWRVPPLITLLIWVAAALLLVVMIGTAVLMTDAMLDHWIGNRSLALRHVTPEGFDRLFTTTWQLAVFLIAVALISAVMKKAWLSRMLFYVAVIGGPATIVIAIVRAPATATSRFPIPSDPEIVRWFWVWLLLWAVSWAVRNALVQFVGDVAVYVEPHRVDRFFALREKIRKTVFDAADAVYRACDANGTPLYDRVLIVAHSLGSVAAYDALNALLRREAACGGNLQIAERTGALITFGSPLDKTAFLFSTQRASHQREPQDSLANAVQPLIQKGRRPRWINLYSRNDIISGRLDYYHVRGVRRVINCEDRNATIPLVAHVEYWQNRLLWMTVLRFL